MMTSLQSDYERVLAMVESTPTLLPNEFIVHTFLVGSLVSFLAVTLLFFVVLAILSSTTPHRSRKFIVETSYVLTSTLGNAVIGVMGVYYSHITKAMSDDDVSLETQLYGFPTIVYPLCCLQTGKQLWAFCMGLFVVNEPLTMLLHHFAVNCCSTGNMTLTTSFSYFAPNLLGTIELSSLPLAVVNLFKKNPAWQTHYPQEYAVIRLVFAASFLYVRWYICLPEFVALLRVIALRLATWFATHQYVIFTLGSIAGLATAFLCLLQVYWGIIILRNIVKAAMNKKKSKTEAKNDDTRMRTKTSNSSKQHSFAPLQGLVAHIFGSSHKLVISTKKTD